MPPTDDAEPARRPILGMSSNPDGSVHVEIHASFTDPKSWGVVLCGAIRAAASQYAAGDPTADARRVARTIKGELDREWLRPQSSRAL